MRNAKQMLTTPYFRFAFCLVPALLGAMACRPQPGTQGSTRPSALANGARSGDGDKLTPEQQALVDPCAIQLHDISGAMLLYYVAHRELPQRLEELKPLADVGSELKFTCSSSGKPYVYVPNGLQSSGRNKRIILHDPEGSHDGNYWCVLMAPTKSGQAPYLEVVLMPPNLFRTYLLISEQRN